MSCPVGQPMKRNSGAGRTQNRVRPRDRVPSPQYYTESRDFIYDVSRATRSSRAWAADRAAREQCAGAGGGATGAGPARGGGRGLRRTALGVGALLAAVRCRVAAYLVAGDKVPRGTTVAGVAVGGLTEDEAAQRLEDELAAAPTATLEVTVGDRTTEVSPEEAGISMDYAASVAEAEPGRAGALRGCGTTRPAATRCRPWSTSTRTRSRRTSPSSATRSAPNRWRARSGSSPRASGSPIRSSAPSSTPTAPRDALVAAYLDEDDATAELPLAEDAPDIDAGDVERARTAFADPAVSGPVTFRFGDAEVSLKPRQFVRALRLVPEDGELVPQLRPKALAQQLSGLVSGDGARPGGRRDQAARRQAAGDPGQAGVSLRPGRGRRPRSSSSSPVRRASARWTCPSEVVEPAFTHRGRQGTRASRRRSRRSRRTSPTPSTATSTSAGPPSSVDGTIVKPGETFSLNGTVGERTAENGFVEGLHHQRRHLQGGPRRRRLPDRRPRRSTRRSSPASSDVEHKPHSFYIDRYPVGREATVAWPTVDLQFAQRHAVRRPHPRRRHPEHRVSRRAS